MKFLELPCGYQPRLHATVRLQLVVKFVYFRSAFLGLWVKLRKLTADEIKGWENKRRITTSLVWFLLSLGLAIVVPNIGKAIAIVGGFAAHFIFTFPGRFVMSLISEVIRP